MHEMSVAMNIWEMAQEAASRAGCKHIVSLTVQYGQISGIMPEALKMAFQALIQDTSEANASLILEMIPLNLKCPFCGTQFSGKSSADIFMPCPKCGESFGHTVETGKELILARIEAE